MQLHRFIRVLPLLGLLALVGCDSLKYQEVYECYDIESKDGNFKYTSYLINTTGKYVVWVFGEAQSMSGVMVDVSKRFKEDLKTGQVHEMEEVVNTEMFLRYKTLYQSFTLNKAVNSLSSNFVNDFVNDEGENVTPKSAPSSYCEDISGLKILSKY